MYLLGYKTTAFSSNLDYLQWEMDTYSCEAVRPEGWTQRGNSREHPGWRQDWESARVAGQVLSLSVGCY